MLPVTLAQFVHIGWVQSVGNFFAWGSWPNTICYGILIFIFTYFYTAISLNIKELADNMKKYGGFIPGIRPGEPTMIYIDKVMSRITLAGALSWHSLRFFRTLSEILPVSRVYTSAAHLY